MIKKRSPHVLTLLLLAAFAAVSFAPSLQARSRDLRGGVDTSRAYTRLNDVNRKLNYFSISMSERVDRMESRLGQLEGMVAAIDDAALCSIDMENLRDKIHEELSGVRIYLRRDINSLETSITYLDQLQDETDAAEKKLGNAATNADVDAVVTELDRINKELLREQDVFRDRYLIMTQNEPDAIKPLLDEMNLYNAGYRSCTGRNL